MTLCLRPSILFGDGARLWRARREILGEDQPGLTFRSKITEQAPEAGDVNSARVIGQGRVFLAQPTNPTEQMRIAAQLRKVAHVRKIGLEIGQEAIGGHSIVSGGTPERLNLGGKDLLQVRGRGLWLRTRSHRSCGTDKRIRFSTARAYSRHTSWGAI